MKSDQTASAELSGQGLHFAVLSASFEHFYKYILYPCCLKVQGDYHDYSNFSVSKRDLCNIKMKTISAITYAIKPWCQVYLVSVGLHGLVARSASS